MQDIDKLQSEEDVVAALRVQPRTQRPTEWRRHRAPRRHHEARTGQTYYTIRVSMPPEESPASDRVRSSRMPVEAFVQTATAP